MYASLIGRCRRPPRLPVSPFFIKGHCITLLSASFLLKSLVSKIQSSSLPLVFVATKIALVKMGLGQLIHGGSILPGS